MSTDVAQVTAAIEGEQNPFVRYRNRLDSYARAAAGGIGDQQFVEMVERLDAQVATVCGHGFVATPISHVDGNVDWLDTSAIDLAIKFESANVGGSHKARHLFGVALHLLIDHALGTPMPARLAIASCGNAALGASIIARALDVPLDVFVPTWAEPAVLNELASYGAVINTCERRDDEAGDPAYLRFREAVDAGARPFSVQGTDTPTTFDGGRTLGWEIADQWGEPDALYVQVGGGALATSTGMALPNARLYPVQAEGCAPLAAAWDRLAPAFDFESAAADPDRYMTPWPDPSSLATGILDDITYDWLRLLQHVRASGGEPIVTPEPSVVETWQLTHQLSTPATCTTGTAGLSGLRHRRSQPRLDSRERAVVIFSGKHRG